MIRKLKFPCTLISGLILACAGFYMSSCSFLDSSEEVPMYFQIDSVGFETKPEEGINTAKINAVAAFAYGFSIGVYEIPARIPVIEERENLDLVLFGNIRNNGIASNPINYPFFEPLEYNFEFEPGATRKLNPVFKYSDASNVRMISDFESGNDFTVNVDNNPGIVFKRSSETPYGNFCGKITLSNPGEEFEKSTFTAISKQEVANGSVFLEMDYRNEIPIAVGVFRIESGGLFVPFYKLVLNEQDDWNKVYIELTTEIADAQVENFTILIGSAAGNTNTGSVWIDNLRLLHF